MPQGDRESPCTRYQAVECVTCDPHESDLTTTVRNDWVLPSFMQNKHSYSVTALTERPGQVRHIILSTDLHSLDDVCSFRMAPSACS